MDRFVRDDADVAFEYELQKSPQNQLTWRRYLDQNTRQLQDSLVKTNVRINVAFLEQKILWLYERFCFQFPTDPDVWLEYIRWIVDIKTNGTQYYIRFNMNYKDISKIFERCLSNFNDTTTEKPDDLCLMFIKFAIHHYDLSIILAALDMGLKKCKIKKNHSKIWELVLQFIEEKELPINEEDNYGKKSSELDFYLNSFDDEIDYLDEEEEKLQIDTLIRGSQILSFNRNNTDEDNNSSSRIKKQPDIWSSYILCRYLRVCPVTSHFEILERLTRTKDYKNIKIIFDSYLSLSKKEKKLTKFVPNSKIPFVLHLHYLKILHRLNFHEDFNKFLELLYKTFPSNSTQLCIIEAKYNISRKNIWKAEDLLYDKLGKVSDIKEYFQIYHFLLNLKEIIIDHLENAFNNDTLNLEEKSKDEWLEILKSQKQKFTELVDSNELRKNDLRLIRNVNDIEAWFERLELVKSDKLKLLNTYVDAIMKITPYKVLIPGALGKLWCDYATVYWTSSNRDTAREIYNRALMVPFPNIADLEFIWTHWWHHDIFDGGLLRQIQILETALEIPESPDLLIEQYSKKTNKIPTQAVIFSSPKLWEDYLELLEAAFKSKLVDESKVKSAYESCISLKVASPMTFIYYAQFLRDEEDALGSFQIYERAINYFPSETKVQIWKIYIPELLFFQKESPESISLEQIRDVFDTAQSVIQSSNIDFNELYFLYSDFEEEVGGFKSTAVNILKNAALFPYKQNGNHIPVSGPLMENNLKLWDTCFEKANSLLDLRSLIPIYEECIQVLPNSKVMKYIYDFITLVIIPLGENDFAREVFKFGAQLFPPSRNEKLWDLWEKFEVEYGSKESFKDMFRMKNNLQSTMKVNTEEESAREGNIQFVASNAPIKGSETHEASNPEEIDLDI